MKAPAGRVVTLPAGAVLFMALLRYKITPLGILLRGVLAFSRIELPQTNRQLSSPFDQA